MNTAIFDTDKAIFSFDLGDVLGLLACFSSGDQVEEVTHLLETLETMWSAPLRLDRSS
jgi:hypothetical protein